MPSKRKDTTAPAFISVSPRIERVLSIVRRVADTDVPILILGESGVGKELLARVIHHESRHGGEPIVKINCSALTSGSCEAELFGREPGTFAGSAGQSCGKLELAGNGTVLLDQVGEMELATQAKFLHVLQDREFTRVGGAQALPVRSRFIATGNQELDRRIQDGEFRQDLYFRLAVILVEIPPLRERREDIPVLAAHFVEKYREAYDVDATEIPASVLAEFHKHEWPGNVRELENAVRRYLLLRDPTRTIVELHHASAGLAGKTSNTLESGSSLLDIGAAAAEEAERRAVLEMLDRTNWNRKQAAQQLGVCYKTLLNKLNRWEIEAESAGTRAAAS